MSGSSLKSLLTTAVKTGAKERIFGHIINPTGLRTCHKILRKKLIGEKVAAWYPYDVRNDDPIIIKDQEEDRLDKLETFKRRGKGPPKKGQGKRASKRK